MTSFSTGGGSRSLETPLNFANIESQRSSLAAASDDGALSSNASTIPITDRSNSSPSTETPLLSMGGGAGLLESLPSSSCSSTTISNNSRDSQSNSNHTSNSGGSDAPPALPPRPPNLPIPNGALEESHLPPHAFPNNQDSRLYSERAPLSHHHHHHHHPSSNQSHEDLKKTWWKRVTKKYVLLCILCGGVCILLGILFGVIFFLLRHYTSSLHYFQTLPTYIPSIMLIVTGIMVLCFGRRGNRNGYLIKICGAFCLLSALVCVVVTVTTTVIHMNRLQTLRECVYQGSSKTCTCFAGILLDPTIHHDATLRYVFANAPNCEVIHGILYSCLRAMFGLSVIGILVCIFSSMLVYQLLSHEKKKKYWEQLEVRCQHLYRLSPPTLGGASGSPHCGCCFDSSANSASGLRTHPTSSCHWPNAALDILDERYWPLNRNGPPSSITNTSSNHQQQQISTVENLSSSNNIYSPNPSSVGPDTLLTSLSSSDPSSSHPEVVSRSISLRSMRTWFRRLSRADSPSGRRGAGHSNGGYPGTLSHPTYIPALHPHLHHHHHHPLHPHHHHHPRMHLHQLWRLSSHSDSQYGFRVPPSSTSVSLPEPPLPQYQPPHHVLWGPPPPYSNSNSNHPSPTHQQNPNNESSPHNEERTELSSSLPTSSSTPLQTTALTNTLTSSTSSNNPVCRTTKSGLLMDKASEYDETVKSAMHIYSKTSSLPSRRPKKPRGSIDPSYVEIPLSAKSLADITKDKSIEEEFEALSVHEVRRKLKTLGLYKVHQRSKTARELAEIRQALNDLQGKSESYYYAPSSTGDSSTNENKYETIGQSIRPYKIPEPQINASTTPDSSISSHYAQISPLHGMGLPSGAMSSTPNSPIKSYFKEIVRSSDLKSLPIEAIRGGDDPQTSPPIISTPYSSQLLHSLNSVGARKGFHKSSSSSMEILSSSADHSALLRPLPMRRSELSSGSSANNTPQKLSNSDTKLWNSNSHPKNTPPSSTVASSTGNNSNKRKSTPVQQCVYLRPEQNIPDIFGNAAFKPILDGSDANFKNNGASRGASEEEGSTGDAVISRDDIVVAMRSVNV